VTPRALIVVIGLLATLTGCAAVRPWERERLARRCMEPDQPLATSAFQAHVAAVRFGDAPALSGGGGGCGCR
jgi:hypothetical protein